MRGGMARAERGLDAADFIGLAVEVAAGEDEHTAGAARQQHLGEAARGRADVEAGAPGRIESEVVQEAESIPFRFYDNRQKYLLFVNTC